MTDKRVEIIGLCMENNRRFTSIDMELFRKLDNYKATIEDAKEVISSDPVTEYVRRLVEAIKRLNDMRHADNATGNSFVPDRTNTAIDVLENELKKWSGE